MTIQEIIDQEEGSYKTVTIYEGTSFKDATIISEEDVNPSEDIAKNWDYGVDREKGCYDENLKILVQPEKVIKYIHVGAPAPQYAINSISRIRSAITEGATAVGVYAREETGRIESDIILEPDTTAEQAKEIFEKAKEHMDGEGYTDVDSGDSWLTYDAGRADLEETEPTRNW